MMPAALAGDPPPPDPRIVAPGRRAMIAHRLSAATQQALTAGVPALTAAVIVHTTVQRIVRGLEVFLRETNSAVFRFAGSCTMSVRNVQTNPLYVNATAPSFAYVVRDLAADLRLQP